MIRKQLETIVKVDESFNLSFGLLSTLNLYIIIKIFLIIFYVMHLLTAYNFLRNCTGL